MIKKPLYTVPENKRVRVIIDTDAYAEADDHFAIVQALLTPKFDVVGIIAEQFGKRDFQNSMEESYHEIKKILYLMGMDTKIPVYRGEIEPLCDECNSGNSEGARFIVEEALKDDERPLFVLNMGAITNLASAYLMNKQIADKLIAVWIGGGEYPLGMLDFNAKNDLNAANVIVASPIELWQIPMSAYTMMEVSFHELFDRIGTCGEIGHYLMQNLLRVNEKECANTYEHWPFYNEASKGARTMIIRSGEGWVLGDNPAVGVLITAQRKFSEERLAQRINQDGSYGDFIGNERKVRVYQSIDSRVILEDMFSKIRYHFG